MRRLVKSFGLFHHLQAVEVYQCRGGCTLVENMSPTSHPLSFNSPCLLGSIYENTVETFVGNFLILQNVSKNIFYLKVEGGCQAVVYLSQEHKTLADGISMQGRN